MKFQEIAYSQNVSDLQKLKKSNLKLPIRRILFSGKRGSENFSSELGNVNDLYW